jgi:hypothetical protein
MSDSKETTDSINNSQNADMKSDNAQTTEAELRAELEMYREAALYDACMSGPIFRGWNRSALDRARKVTEKRTLREAEHE